MSEEDKGNLSSRPSASSKKRTYLIVGVVIVVVAIGAILAMVMMGANDGPNMSIETWSVDQSYSGQTTFTIEVTNTGNEAGSATLVCLVNNGIDLYTNSQTVNVNPGSSTTVTIVVPTNFGTTVTKSMCNVNFE